MFENLVNYDNTKTIIVAFTSLSWFENLVNYDNTKTFGKFPPESARLRTL